MSERLLTTAQVAEAIGINPEEVCRRIRAGEIPGKLMRGPRRKPGARRSRPTYRVLESELTRYMQDLPDVSPDRGAVPRARPKPKRSAPRGRMAEDVIEFV
jgi:hypothetical protein